jgi:peptide/nickel transport system ATP-binding protein/oligopeptide transport system ATP-binding protein
MSTPALTASSRAGTPLLRVEGLKKHFPVAQGLLARTHSAVRAVDGVSFAIDRGETLALVGESGCGKSTVGRVVLNLITPTAGSVQLGGEHIAGLSRARMLRYRRRMQVIFQDPYSSLNPRMTAGELVGEPLAVHGVASGSVREDRVSALFRRVGLQPEQMKSYPHEFSGGQRQRVGIARALAVGPELIVADEPVSALDVSIQAQVVNLLMDVQAELGIAYLFIAHDLSVVEHMSHRVAVMYLGRIVEHAPRRALFNEPLHPYTEALLSAVPRPEPRRKRRDRIVLHGELPNPADPPSGCHFHTRCPYAFDRCIVEAPALRELRPGHWASCHLR